MLRDSAGVDQTISVVERVWTVLVVSGVVRGGRRWGRGRAIRHTCVWTCDVERIIAALNVSISGKSINTSETTMGSAAPCLSHAER